MLTHSYCPSRTNTESSEPVMVEAKPPASKPQHQQPQVQTYDFSHVDLFTHAPQRTPVQMKFSPDKVTHIEPQESGNDKLQAKSSGASHDSSCSCSHCAAGSIQRKLDASISFMDQTSSAETNSIQRGFFNSHYTVTIAGQKVRVKNRVEEQNATRIIQKIQDDYGIRLDSDAGIDALKANYNRVPSAITDQLKASTWHHKELVALETALSHYAPILGASRATSPVSGKAQEVSAFSKLAKSIKENVPHTTKLSESDYGEYFADQNTVSLFGLGTSFATRKFTGKLTEFFGATDFSSLADQLEGTMIHEIAHGVFKGDEKYFTNQGNLSEAFAADSPTQLITEAGSKLHDSKFMAEMQSKVTKATKEELEDVQTELATRIALGNYDASVSQARDALKAKMALPGADQGSLLRELMLISHIDSALKMSATEKIQQQPNAQGEINPAYWGSDEKKTKNKHAEKPVTTYGQKNPSEDLCETAMFYFKQPQELQTKAPQRYSIIDKLAKQKGL